MNTQQNAPVLQSAMQAAIHSANILNEQKSMKPSEDKKSQVAIEKSGEMPLVVVRKDVLGNVYLFRADTENREAGTIEYYDGKKGSGMQVAPIEFYRNTKPLDSEEELKGMIQNFSRAFGFKTVHTRARLLKESVMRKADPEKEGDEKAARKEFADKLVASITKAVYDALGQ